MRHAMTLGLVLASVLAVGHDVYAENESGTKQAKAKGHVLDPLLEAANKREAEIRKNVHDYTCKIVKRERINGVLQEHRFMRAKVRSAGTHNGKQQPLSVHIQFLKPEEVAGRQVIYVEGKNDGMMVVKRGGTRFSTVTTKVDPDSDLARTESTMHIGHLGLDGMVEEIIEHLRDDVVADPDSSNTKVKLTRKASINGRSCTAVVITHPNRGEGLTYHRAEFFIDNEYHLPARVAAYDWPESEGANPKMLAEFTYTDVKINVGLTDADFDIEQLRTASR